MPSLNAAEFLQGAAAASVVLRLLLLRLAPPQIAILFFVLFNAVTPFLAISLPSGSAGYFWAFLFYTLLNWVVSFFAVREMFALTMNSYPGVRTLARWVLSLSTALSLLLSAALTPWLWGAGRSGRSHLFFIQVADRSILLTLALIVAGLLLFLSRYPLHLPRSTYVSCILFSSVLLCQAAVDLIDSFRTHLYSHYADTAAAFAYVALYAAWAILLRPQPASESRRISFEKPDEADLLQQLEAMNRLLIRVGRR